MSWSEYQVNCPYTYIFVASVFLFIYLFLSKVTDNTEEPDIPPYKEYQYLSLPGQTLFPDSVYTVLTNLLSLKYLYNFYCTTSYLINYTSYKTSWKLFSPLNFIK